MHYPGGKGQVFKNIINLIPPHDVYIEPYLGGGAILRNKRPTKRNIGIEIDPDVIKLWNDSSIPINFELIQGDAIGFLKNFQYSGKEFIYCDPPYLRSTRKKFYPIYKYEYSIDQHISLLKLIKSLPCMVMISGYRSQLYIEQLENWQTNTFKSKTHHGTANEWLWMNYSSPTKLHDYRYLGDNYRERARIKILIKRWLSKLEKLPVLEREALLSEIYSIYK